MGSNPTFVTAFIFAAVECPFDNIFGVVGFSTRKEKAERRMVEVKELEKGERRGGLGLSKPTVRGGIKTGSAPRIL